MGSAWFFLKFRALLSWAVRFLIIMTNCFLKNDSQLIMTDQPNIEFFWLITQNRIYKFIMFYLEVYLRIHSIRSAFKTLHSLLVQMPIDVFSKWISLLSFYNKILSFDSSFKMEVTVIKILMIKTWNDGSLFIFSYFQSFNDSKLESRNNSLIHKYPHTLCFLIHVQDDTSTL